MASSHQHRRRHQNSSLPTASSSSNQPNLGFLTAPPPYPYSNPHQNPNTSAKYDGKIPDSAAAAAVAGLPPPSITPAEEDVYLFDSSHLTRQEVIRRRAHNLKQLSRVYRDHYWAMMEELKVKYRDYVWNYGLSPFKEDEESKVWKEEVTDVGVGGSRGETGLEANATCAFYGCALKAMALTRFCHLHILSDSKQVLYKPCEYVIKSAQAGPITCGRPILRGRVPAFCNVHLQKTHRPLKKTGLDVSSSSELAPKFHVIVAEYVRQIQAKRRTALRENRNNVVVKQDSYN
ncbi:hypothetical protein U1Q18_030470 [Sarracenia purpurea var. burkii]